MSAGVQQFFVAPRVAPRWHQPTLPRQTAQSVQKEHGRIENGLHYRRDATLGEDRTRLTNKRFAEVLSILNNSVVSLTQKLQVVSLASARRQFDARTSELLAHVHDC